MPNTGDVIRDRSPYWDRGIESIEIAISTLRLRFPTHDWSSVILAGHSQGGDIAAKLASRPGFTARALMTLDNRRVPLPTSGQLPVLSIRSSDQPADFGVLPAQVAQGRTKTCVVRMPSTRHDDMNNSADGPAKARMTELALRFLRNEGCTGDA
jgi:pimeloyl-ACP methyl ester carboxylesterase